MARSPGPPRSVQPTKVTCCERVTDSLLFFSPPRSIPKRQPLPACCCCHGRGQPTGVCAIHFSLSFKQQCHAGSMAARTGYNETGRPLGILGIDSCTSCELSCDGLGLGLNLDSRRHRDRSRRGPLGRRRRGEGAHLSRARVRGVGVLSWAFP